MKTAILARQLGDFTDINHILTESADCARYSVQGVIPQLVVAPRTVTELSQVMAAAYEAGAVVVPWGGGTQQSYGRAPEQIDLLVRTERLNRVVEYEPDDLTISVEAGLTLGALDDLLAEHGQMLPLDAPLPRQATLGGLLATAMDGPRRLGYGTSRDLLIGIGVVESTGRVSKAGGMVVKNVSGFDMMKLYLGSMGTLAIIVSANFKLIPRPRAAATVVCGFDSSQDAFTLADAIHTSQLIPAAVEYLSSTTEHRAQSEGVNESSMSHVSRLLSPISLAIRAEGLPAAVERHERDVAKLAQANGARSVEVVHGDEHRALWEAINDMPQTATVAPDELVVRLACLPSEIGAALQHAETLRDDGLALRIVARALSGVAYLRLQSNDSDRLVAAYDALATALGRAAPSAQISVLAEPQAIRGQLLSRGASVAGHEVMRRIKDEFDPQSTLNPGRMVYGA